MRDSGGRSSDHGDSQGPSRRATAREDEAQTQNGDYEDDGTLVLHGRFPPETGARILSALDAAMEAHAAEQPASSGVARAKRPASRVGRRRMTRVRSLRSETGSASPERAFPLTSQVGRTRVGLWSTTIVTEGRYVYREAMFPTPVFRRAYDTLVERSAKWADPEYIRILHLSATTMQCEVEAALAALLEAEQVPEHAEVAVRVGSWRRPSCPEVRVVVPDLAVYDTLLEGREGRP